MGGRTVGREEAGWGGDVLRRSVRDMSKYGLGREGGIFGWGMDSVPSLSLERVSRPWPDEPKPVVDMHIWTVALDMRSKASRHVSAGGHFSIMSPRTEVAARIVKSTSSMV